MNKVVVVGSYNVDMTVTTDRLPKVGETVIGNSLDYGHGGKGANQAVAAARAGAHVQLIARVGDDQHGHDAIKGLQAEGIQTTSISKESGSPTGMAFITVDGQGDNNIIVISGANCSLASTDIEVNENAIKSADVLLTQLETPLESVTAAIAMAHRHGVTVILDPAPVQMLSRDVLEHVDIITPNAIEAEMLTGIKIDNDVNLERATQTLHSFGVETVLVTLGSQGVYVSSPGLKKLLPPIDVNVVDTVGAGDVFSGVLAANYQGLNRLEEALNTAIVASGLSVTHPGAQTAIPYQKDVLSRLEERVSVESL